MDGKLYNHLFGKNMKTIIYITILLLPAQVLHASLTLDQYYHPAPISARVGPDNVYQSFECGLAGQLSGIDLLLDIVDGGNRDIIVSLWNSSADESLGSVTLNPWQLPPGELPDGNTWVPFIFEEQGIIINPGTTYIIELSQGAGDFNSVNWDGSEFGTYSAGAHGYRDVSESVVFTGFDLGFRTYVIVPEPAAGLLFTIGIFIIKTKHCRTCASRRRGEAPRS